MGRLPEGRVTFVFTDIEGSTRLFQRVGDAYRDLLEDHRALLNEAWRRHHGVVVGTEGDSFFVAFSAAADAVAACVDGQLALGGHRWPSSCEVRVRMGVHTGEAIPVNNDYVALAVHQAARVAAVGHGGQIVVSEITRTDVGTHLPERASFVALGRYRLKDFDAPQELHQVAHRDLTSEFPALKALPAEGHNLPQARTKFVGREAEVAELSRAVESSPMVTVTGLGGVGKTRLALEVARRVIPSFPDGVWFIELAQLADAASVPSAVAVVVGVREEPGRPLLATLVDALRSRRALLVLDNCEHVLDACVDLAGALLAGAPNVAMLVTSREPIAAETEQIWSVAPLTGHDAEHLFVERAAAARRDFVLDAATAQTVSEVCRALDGLPLAVELAAARVSAFSPAQILRKLEDRFALLATQRRDAPDRHRSLHAAIDWSYSLLSPAERRLLRRLTVFRGGCTLEAAERVVGAEVDTLQSLVDKSLVVAHEGRFSLLETVRAFASELAGNEAGLQRDHAEFFAEAAPDLGWRARGSDHEAFDAIEADYENALAAFDWALAHDRFDLCASFVEGLWYHWVRRGLVSDGYRWALAALDRSTEPTPRLISLTAELARFNGDLERAADLKSLSLARLEAEDAPPSRLAVDCTDLAETLIQLGRLDEGERFAERGLALREQDADAYGVAHAQAAFVQLELARGNYGLAASIAEESMPAFRATSRWSDLAWACIRAAHAYRRAGDTPAARRCLREALRLGEEIQEAAAMVAAVEQVAAIAVASGDDEIALQLLGAARRGRARTGYAFETDTGVTEFKGPHLDREIRAAAVAEGESWDLDEACRRAGEYL